jgi:hypothetical protein
MLTEKESELVELWSKDMDAVQDAILNEESSLHREMSQGLLQVIQGFENQTKFIPTGKDDFLGIEDLYTAIQFQFEGGDDLMKD